MIKLYLHCGYHKTGSSFLQSLFALNRESLIENNIYFPKSKEEMEMISGNISPGNGMELVRAIRGNDQNLIIDILKKWKDEANENISDILLISSESLFHALAEQKLMELFVNSCNKAGIKDINALLFLRDPVSHAFSVYKHRGKRGDITDYGDWLENKYETLDLTKYFLSIYNEFDINWTFRKYKSDSNFMYKATFDDWLDVKLTDTILDRKVNISLTLSEISMITEIKHLLPKEYIIELHARLSKLPKSKKANDLDLQVYYKEISNKVLSKYENVIKEVNQLLPIGESLEFEDTHKIDKINSEVISLSRDQLKIFFESIDSNNHIIDKISFYTKNLFSKIKRKISYFF